MLTGSCLCGDIQYNLDQEIDSLYFCHCSRCRKETGSAFNSAALIQSKNIKIVNGKESLTHFSINGVNRIFCKNCGTKIYTSRDNDLTQYRLRVGTLNENIYPNNKIHVFVGSKANWDEIHDNYPQFIEK